MKTSIIHRFFFFFLLFHSIYQHQACECPSVSTQPASSLTPSDLSLSPSNETINGVDYGPLIYLNKLIFLTKDVPVTTSTLTLSNNCPLGFRPPTFEEYTSILALYKLEAYQILIGKAFYDPAFSYMTSKKTYTNITSGSDANAYVFNCLAWDKLLNVRLDVCNTYFGKASQRVKCVLDTNIKRNIEVTGISSDLLPKKEYSFGLNNTNVMSYYWNLVNESVISANKSINFTPKNDGCKVLVVKARLFSGALLETCLRYYVTSPIASRPNKTELYELSSEEEQVNGVNYGRLIILNKNVWLTYDVTSGKTTNDNIPNSCPINYRPPTLVELQGVLTNLKSSSDYILTRIANYTPTWNYMTNTKSYPNTTGDQTWYFKGLTLDSQSHNLSILDIHTYWKYSLSRIKCLRSSLDNDFSIKGQPISDLYVGLNYTFEIQQTNAIAFRWDLGLDGGIKINRSVVYTPKSMARKRICVNVTVFGGGQKSKCIEFYVQPSSPSDNSPKTNGGVELSMKEEVYDGVNFGKLIRFRGLVWFKEDVDVSKSIGVLSSGCPNGFSPPTNITYNTIISSLGDDAYYTLVKQANYNLNYTYLTVNITGTSVYVFEGIRFSENPNKITPISVNTYFSYSTSRAKCLLSNISSLNIFIKGLPIDDLELGLQYQWEIVEPNAISYNWNFGNATISINPIVIFKADKEERRSICVNVNVSGWFTKSRCFDINVKRPFRTSADPTKIVKFSDEIVISQEDEIIEGENFGKLIKIGTQIWLSNDVSAANSFANLNFKCPSGFRGPTMDEYLNLVGVLSSNASQILLNKTNMNSSRYYMTTTKKEDWVYKAMTLDGKSVKVIDVKPYFNTQKSFVRCVMNNFNLPFEIKGLPSSDLILKQGYLFELMTTNSLNYQWKIGNNSYNTRSITFSPQNLGKIEICITINWFAGYIKAYCLNKFVVLQYNKDISTTLTQNNYKNITIPNIKINSVTGLHFGGASAPLAPRDNGNVYLMYSQTILNYLIVIELFPNGTIVPNSACNLTRKARPLDIVATPWGFSAYIRYDNLSKSTLIGVFSNCTVKFEKTLMNNQISNDGATTPRDQIMFYTSIDPLSQPFGMKAMFNPHNGRLSYARERLGLIFAHYNHFGLKTDGSKEVHTGDTFISFDDKNGEDTKLGWSWATSHSLNQASLWDGEKFITASLGDAYPMGIQIARCEGVESNKVIELFTNKTNRLDCSFKTNVFDGLIVGNGAGDSAGRLGGLFMLKNEEYGLVYSRRSSNISSVVNSQNEIGFVVFNKSLGFVRKAVLRDGQFNNILHAARYGCNILVGYSISTCLKGDFVCPRYVYEDKFYLRLVNPNGGILGEIQVFSLPASDDFEVLADGRIAWVSFGTDGSLTYHYLTAPGN